MSGPTPIGTASLCPGSTGRATPGSVGVRAEASISRTLDGPFPDTSLSRAAATARFTDILSIGIESGSLTIPLDFASNVLFETQGALFTDTFVLFQGTLSGAGTSSGFSYGISQAGDSDVRTALGVPRFVRDVTFEFDGGSLALASSLSVTADCGTPRPEGGSCILDADALASLRFLGATLRDETGALRDDVAITSTSGFDYRAGVEPHAAIPLPATAALLLSGLAGLVLLGRDRRSASVAA